MSFGDLVTPTMRYFLLEYEICQLFISASLILPKEPVIPNIRYSLFVREASADAVVMVPGRDPEKEPPAPESDRRDRLPA